MEEAKKLQPTKDTLRRLYISSGNKCAFYECMNSMFNKDGGFVGKILHIEPAIENKNSISNLMLVCCDHYTEASNKAVYSVDALKKIKKDHEKVYNNVNSFISQMQESSLKVVKPVKNNSIQSLSKLFIGAYGEDVREQLEIKESAKAFSNALPKFSGLSSEARRLFSVALAKSRHQLDASGLETTSIYFDPSEIARVTGLNLAAFKSLVNELQVAGFVVWKELERGYFPFINFPNSNVNFWEVIKSYCLAKNVDLVNLIDKMEFADF